MAYSKDDDKGKRWVLTFRSEPSAVPATCRIRRLLKSMLRAYGLRAVSIMEQPRYEVPGTSDKQGNTDATP